MDQETERIVKDFTSILDELTFNSKPIITTLTKMAEENISCAQYFVDALETRINRCVPTQKLYAFYALDSICKNAGSPYTIYFSKNLFALYKKAYLLVDNTTRSKLISLFKTWLNPSESTGNPLFESSSLGRIERFLIKASALHQKNFQSMLAVPTIPLLLKDIDKLTILTEQRLKKNPNDEKLNVKLQVLSQLKQELQNGKLSQAALKQVQLQLKEVFSQDQLLIQQQQEYELRQQQKQQANLGFRQSQSDNVDNNNNNEDRSVSNSAVPIPLFDSSKDNGPNVSSLFGEALGVLSPQNFMELGKTTKITKVQNLYQSLDYIGLMYKPSSESIVTLYDKLKPKESNGSENTASVRLPAVDTLQNILYDCKAYFANININISNIPTLSFSQQNLLSENPVVQNNLIHLLYRAKSNKCSTCGKRFGNSSDERRLLSEHLDWHFRINKRIKGSSHLITGTASGSTATQKNIQSRTWYLQSSQWINFKDDDIISIKNISGDDENRTKNKKDQKKNVNNAELYKPENVSSLLSNSTSANFKLDEDSLRTLKVNVPESIEDMTFKCPICKEVATAVYDEDSGEWVWKNALEVNGKYFHAVCYYESIKNSGNNNHVTELTNLINLNK